MHKLGATGEDKTKRGEKRQQCAKEAIRSELQLWRESHDSGELNNTTVWQQRINGNGSGAMDLDKCNGNERKKKMQHYWSNGEKIQVHHREKSSERKLEDKLH